MKYLPFLIIPVLVYVALQLLPVVHRGPARPLQSIGALDISSTGGEGDNETKVVVGFEEYMTFPEGYKYLNLDVYEEVTFLGWSNKLNDQTVCSDNNLAQIALVTRSDVLVYDGMACLYATAGVEASPPLDSLEVGQKSVIKGRVQYQDGKPYIGPVGTTN